jgi:sugar lactone lactonase YvrE
VMRIDPLTGERTPLSGCPGLNRQGNCRQRDIGEGEPLREPLGIAVEATGDLVVVDVQLRAVVRVDPHTGRRTTVSGCAAIDAERRCVGGIVGGGDRFVLPTAVAVEETGDLVIVDPGLEAVLRVDPHTGDRAVFKFGAGKGVGPGLVSPSGLAVESDGSLVVTDPGLKLVVRIDPHTGDRTQVSGCTALNAENHCVGEIIGPGPAFDQPAALAVEATGDLVVVDMSLRAVMRVDPHTGERTPVSGCPAIDALGNCQGPVIGEGQAFHSPWRIAIEATGALVVVDLGLKAVVRVDPHTGMRTLVSGCPAIDALGNCQGPIIGKGRTFVVPAGIAIEATGALVVVDPVLQAVLRVDPHTGDRRLVSGCLGTVKDGHCVGEITGRGLAFDFPQSVVVEATGTLVVVDSGLDAVVRVDPVTGDRESVSDPGLGGGLPLIFPVAMALEAAESWVVLERGLDAVIRVDPHTGDRVIVSVGAE